MRSPEQLAAILSNVAILKKIGVTKAAWRYDGQYYLLIDALEADGLNFTNEEIYQAFLHWDDLNESKGGLE